MTIDNAREALGEFLRTDDVASQALSGFYDLQAAAISAALTAAGYSIVSTAEVERLKLVDEQVSKCLTTLGMEALSEPELSNHDRVPWMMNEIVLLRAGSLRVSEQPEAERQRVRELEVAAAKWRRAEAGELEAELNESGDYLSTVIRRWNQAMQRAKPWKGADNESNDNRIR